MNSTTLVRTLALGAIAATFGTTVLAANPTSANAQYGNAVPDSIAQRTIDLRPDTKYVNVTRGETVKFLSQGKAFTWTFDTIGTRPFELAKVAPNDANVGNVVVYVGRNPLYTRD